MKDAQSLMDSWHEILKNNLPPDIEGIAATALLMHTTTSIVILKQLEELNETLKGTSQTKEPEPPSFDPFDPEINDQD